MEEEEDTWYHAYMWPLHLLSWPQSWHEAPCHQCLGQANDSRHRILWTWGTLWAPLNSSGFRRGLCNFGVYPAWRQTQGWDFTWHYFSWVNTSWALIHWMGVWNSLASSGWHLFFFEQVNTPLRWDYQVSYDSEMHSWIVWDARWAFNVPANTSRRIRNTMHLSIVPWPMWHTLQLASQGWTMLDSVQQPINGWRPAFQYFKSRLQVRTRFTWLQGFK